MAEYNLDYFIGSAEVKEIATRIVDGLRHPEKYEEKGLAPANRILLRGFAGVGRETLIRCIAGEADAEIIFVSAFEFMGEDYSERIHRIFYEANRKDVCILCINDFEVFAKEKQDQDPLSAMRLSEFFRSMKEELDRRVCLIAVAEYQIQLEKKAVRSFQTEIILKWPSRDLVIEFLERLVKDMDYLELNEQDMARLAFMTDQYENFFGLAEIKSAIDDAIGSILYQRSGKQEEKGKENAGISGKELIWELEKKLGGYAQKSDPSTAYHEAGHAVMSYCFGRTLEHITIMKRRHYEGYSASKKNFSTRKHIQEEIVIMMAGRAAELAFYGEEDPDEAVNVGAEDDFQRATKRAYQYFKKFAFDMDSMIAVQPEYLLPDNMEEEIWRKVQELLKELWSKTRELVEMQWDSIEALACTLMYTGEVSGALARRIIEYKQPIVEDERDIVERLGRINGRIVETANGLVLDDKLERIQTCIGEVKNLERIIAENIASNSDGNDQEKKETVARLEEKWGAEPLNERLRRVIGAITDGAGAGLTLNQKLELLSNQTFLAIQNGNLDEELAEPIRLNLPINIDDSQPEMTIRAFEEDEEISSAPLTKKMYAFLMKNEIFLRDGEDVFARFLEATTERRAITYGCQVYPPVAIGYRSYSLYGEVEENEELYYVVKSLQEARIRASFNDAMEQVFDMKKSDSHTVCRCFTQKDAAYVYARTLDVIIQRENGKSSIEPTIDGVNRMDDHKAAHDQNEWLYYVLEFGEGDLEQMGGNPLRIAERLNTFSKLFDADDINLFIVVKLWGSARKVYNYMKEWARRTLI